MSDVLSTAITGLNSAVSRATHSANDIVNASSTGKNLDASLVNLKASQVDYAANAAVVKIAKKMSDALLDIEV